MAADGGGKASRLRWLYVARCAVAFVVTVIAVAVLVRAVVVMLRREKLELKVARGSVSMNRIPSMPPRKVTFRFTLTAYNPSGRAFIVFSGVNIRLIDKDAAAKITEFPFPPSISLSQQLAQDSLVTATLEPPDDVPMSYIQALFEGRSISAEIEVDGLLTDRINGISTNSDRIAFYCWPVTIAVGGSSSSSLSSVRGDTPCLDKSVRPIHTTHLNRIDGKSSTKMSYKDYHACFHFAKHSRCLVGPMFLH